MDDFFNKYIILIMGGAVVSRQANIDTNFHNILIPQKCRDPYKTISLFERTKHSVDSNDKFLIRIQLFKLSSKDHVASILCHDVYEISALHCSSGKQTNRVYVHRVKVKIVFEDFLNPKSGRTLDNSELPVIEESHPVLHDMDCGHNSTIEDFLYSHVNIIHTNIGNDETRHELSIHQMLLETVVGENAESIKRYHIQRHKDTMRLLRGGNISL
jgi:uncharacterized protein YjaG (DUF416 family)